jgi:hypothetical protein
VKTYLAALALLALPVAVAPAQSAIEFTRPERGIRIRITDAAALRREGVLVEWRGDSALARIDATGDYVVIPPQRLAELELYDGVQSGAGKGAMLGGGFGLGLGVIVVIASSGESYTSIPAGEAVALVALNTALYAGIGALIGSASKKPRWRAFEANGARLQAGLDPLGRAGLRLSVAF